MIFIKKEKIIIVGVMFISSLVISSIWFYNKTYIHQIDSWFKLNPSIQLQDNLFIWKSNIGLGFVSADFHTIQFVYWQLFLYKIVNIFFSNWDSLIISQYIMYFLTLFVGLYFSFVFFKEFFSIFYKNYIKKFYLILIISFLSFFYIFNQFTLIYIFYRYTAWTILWISIPVISTYLLRYLYTGKILHLVLIAIILFFTPLGGISSFGVIPMVILVYLILGCIFLINIESKKRKITLYRFIIFFFVLISVNFWNIFLQLYSLNNLQESSELSLYSSEEFLEYSSRFTNILNIFMFTGYYALYGAEKNLTRFPYVWIDNLHNPIIKILLFIYPLTFIFVLFFLFIEKDKKLKLNMLLLVLINLFLIFIMKGLNNPVKHFNYALFFFNRVFFRHPYDRFVHIYAFLFFLFMLYLLIKIYYFDKKYLFFSIILIFGLVMTILGINIFTPNFVHPSDRLDLSKTEYLNISKDIRNIKIRFSERYRTLVIPFTLDSGESSYNISGVVHHPNDKNMIYYLLDGKRTVQSPKSKTGNNILNLIYQYMKNRDYDNFLIQMRNSNIKYILYSKDSSEFYLTSLKNKEIIAISANFLSDLNEKGYISQLYRNQNIALYEINYDIQELISLNRVFFYFQKINPTKYKLYITNLNEAQNLSFLESYHKDWKLYLKKNPTNKWCKPIEFYNSTNTTECEHTWKFFEGEELSYLWKKPIFDETHMIVYDYANQWTIDPQYIKDNYSREYYKLNEDGSVDVELVLYFKPQSYFYIGLIISGTTIVVCIIYLIYDWRKGKRGLGQKIKYHLYSLFY